MQQPTFKLKLTLLLCTIALLVPFLTARQAEQATLRGRISERDTDAPLAAEIGLAIHTRQGIVFKHARADESGAFEVTGLPAGEFHLSTKRDGYAVERAALTLSDNESQSVEFRLVKAKLVRGFISDQHQQPLADARLRVLYAQDATAKYAIANTYQWETGDARSDEQGHFELEVHPEREFVIEAAREGWLSEISAPARLTPDETDKTIQLRLTKGISLSGEARDQFGNPLPGAQVQLSDADERPELSRFLPFELLQQSHQFAVADAAGAFRFDNVRPARKLLLVRHSKHAPAQQTLVLSDGQAELTTRVVLNRNDER
jgi:protocatechuate 3,4-dioxygenase beta subunit